VGLQTNLHFRQHCFPHPFTLQFAHSSLAFGSEITISQCWMLRGLWVFVVAFSTALLLNLAAASPPRMRIHILTVMPLQCGEAKLYTPKLCIVEQRNQAYSSSSQCEIWSSVSVSAASAKSKYRQMSFTGKFLIWCLYVRLEVQPVKLAKCGVKCEDCVWGWSSARQYSVWGRVWHFIRERRRCIGASKVLKYLEVIRDGIHSIL
jgi:hypothetical protein